MWEARPLFIWLLFFIAPQLLGPFILPRLQMKKYLFVCSKSKVMIKYIENKNLILFSDGIILVTHWHAPDTDIFHA